jgi:hypothetical protein
MSSREERFARNEAASREINERLEDAHANGARDQDIRMVCECGRERCDRVVTITLAEYERVRSEPTRFLVVREHVRPDIERVVEEMDGFVVVAKEDGAAAEVAVDEDPRT